MVIVVDKTKQKTNLLGAIINLRKLWKDRTCNAKEPQVNVAHPTSRSWNSLIKHPASYTLFFDPFLCLGILVSILSLPAWMKQGKQSDCTSYHYVNIQICSYGQLCVDNTTRLFAHYFRAFFLLSFSFLLLTTHATQILGDKLSQRRESMWE